MKREVKIGLTIVGGVLLLYLGIAWVKSMHFFSVNQDSIRIRFSDLAGLKEGDPVAVFGYPCGHVEAIQLDADGAIVEARIDRKVKIMADAKAEIRVKELMGSKQLAVEPGHSSQPLGSNIITGTTSMDFASAMSKAGTFMDRFDPAQVDSLMTNINKAASAFARMSDDMDSLDTRHLAQDISSSASSMSRLLADVERRKLVDQVDESLSKVGRLSDQAEGTMRSVDRLIAHLEARTLPDADKMLGSVNKLLDDAEGMTNDLKAILRQLQDRNTLAGQLLYDPALAQQLDHTLDNLNVTLDHIRTKKIYVTMTLTKGQKVFSEQPVEINGVRVDKADKGEQP